MSDDATATQRPGPEAMRQVVRDFVLTVHATYLDHVRHLAPGERARLPLVATAELTVVAAAARRLHLVATADAVPAPPGPGGPVADEHDGLRWSVSFFDPSVLPALGVVDDDSTAEVRRVLGVGDTVYHLTVEPGGGLTGHHAQHTGVALANRHAKVVRDLDRLRHLFPRSAATVDELGACARLGLHHAAGLLAADLTGGRVAPRAGVTADGYLEAVLAEVEGG